MAAETLNQILTAAIADFTEKGYTSPEQLAYWEQRLSQAIDAAMTPDDVMARILRETLQKTFQQQIDGFRILRLHPGVARFSLAKVKPQLHAELNRRVMSSANLIRLNKTEIKAKTLRRFSGWATSVPTGGSDVVARVEERQKIRKGVAGAPYEERRVLIDQGHKFVAALSDIIAVDNGALAGKWFSHWRDPGYNYREDHKERDGQIYVMRNNWALKAGLMKVAGHPYTDELTQPGEDVFCRCRYFYIYHLRDLPTDMVTEAGREKLKQVRAA